MMEREEELKRALARIEPPDGFAERVLARLSRQMPARPWKLTVRAAAAAVALAGTLLLFQYHRRREQAEEARVEDARNIQRELAFALRFTAEKLAAIDRQIRAEAPDVGIEKPERKQL